MVRRRRRRSCFTRSRSSLVHVAFLSGEDKWSAPGPGPPLESAGAPGPARRARTCAPRNPAASNARGGRRRGVAGTGASAWRRVECRSSAAGWPGCEAAWQLARRGVEVELARDEARAPLARPPAPGAGGAGLLELPPLGQPRQRGRAAPRGAAAARQPGPGGGRRDARAGRRRAGGGPGALQRARHRPASEAHAVDPPRGRRGDDPPGRAGPGARRHRAAHRRGAGRRADGPARRPAPLLRRHRAHRGGRAIDQDDRLRAVALRQGGRGRLPQPPARRGGSTGPSWTRCSRRRRSPPHGFEEPALLRGLPAHRGDGRARARRCSPTGP